MSSPQTIHAQTARIWTNNSATNNLSNTLILWQGGVNPASGDSWVFANTATEALTNNFSGGFTVGGISFSNGVGSTTIGGNVITLRGSIVNNSTNQQTLNFNVTNSGSNLVNANAGNILFGGVIAGSGTMTFAGAGTTTLSSYQSFANMTWSNSGTLNMAATNTGSYNYLNGGVTINNTGTLNAGNLRFTGAGTNVLNFYGGTSTVGGLTVGGSGGVNSIDLITVYNGATVNASGGSTTLGFYAGSNTLLINSGGTFLNNSGMYLGQAANNSFNVLTNNGMFSNSGAGNISLNAQSGSSNTSILVQSGGMFYNASNLNIGGGSSSSGITGGSNSTALVDVTGGLFTNVGTVTLGFNGSGNTNTFQVDAGLAYVSNLTYGTANPSIGSSNAVILNGGTLIVGGAITTIGSATSTFTWNGGTLKPGGSLPTFLTNAPNLTVTVGARGGTFDANGLSNAIGENIGGSGTLTVMDSIGGGTLSLTASNPFTGTTRLVGGVLSLGTTGSLTGSTNIVISGGNLILGVTNQISSNAPVTLGAGTITLATPGSSSRVPGFTIPSLTLSGSGFIDFSSLPGNSIVSIGALSGLGTNYAGGAKGILNIWNWDPTTNASTTLLAGNAATLSGPQLANINFYSGNGTLLLGSATLSSGGAGTSLVPNPPSLLFGGTNGINSYSVTNAIGCINIGLLGNSTLTFTGVASTLSGTGSLTISGTNNVLSLPGTYPSGSLNVLLSGSGLTLSPGATLAVTGSAVGNGTLTVGQSYTNASTGSIVTLQTNGNSVYLTVFITPQFHVSPSGNDSNPGTATLPFATIQRAQQAVRAYETTQQGSQQEVDVILHAGTYWQTNTLTFTNSDSGSPGAPVVYTNAPGDLVAISGGRVITGTWTQSPGKPYWQISIPDVQAGKWAFDTLTVNGQFATCARYPNEGEKELRGLGAPPGGDSLRSSIYHTGDFDPTWTNQQDISMVWMGNWTGEMHSLTSVDPVNQILYFSNNTGVHTVYYYERLNRYYFRNVFEKLDSPGEWYLNKTTGILYYYPRPGEDLSAAEVIAPVVKTPLVSIRGNLASNLPVQYIQFKGIHFRHADTDIKANSNIYRQGFMFLDGSVTATAFRNGLFQGCTFEQLGDYALNIADGCRDVTVQQCHFWDLGAGAVLIGVTDLTTLLTPAGSGSLAPGQAEPLRLVTNIVVDNNIVHRTGTIWNGPYGIVNRFASYTRITHNEIFDTDWSAIGLDARWDQSGGQVYAQGNEVAYNHIHDVGLVTQTDGGGIYQQGPLNNHIHHNLIHDTFAYPYVLGLHGVYLDANSTSAFVEKNILYNFQGECFFQNTGYSNVINNNIGAFARDGFEHAAGATNGQITQNIYVTTNNVAQGEGMGSYPAGSPPLVSSNFYQTLQSNTTLLYGGYTLTNWQKLGWDLGSVEGNAGFTDPVHGNFSMSPSAAPVSAVGFVPFGQDMASVGLYGDPAWTSLPATQPMRAHSQYQLPQDLAMYNDFTVDPNLFTNGTLFPLFMTSQNSMVVTNSVPGINGSQCIQVSGTNGTNQSFPYASTYLYGLTQGRVQVQLGFMQPTNAPVGCTIECRSSGTPYKQGPSITFSSSGKLTAGKWSYQTTLGQWNMITMTFGLGPMNNGTYTLTVSNSLGVTNTTQPFANTNFADMANLTLYSGGSNFSGSYFLDAISIKTTPTPTGLTASNGVTNVSLNWSAIPGALGYLVQRSGSSNGVYTNLTPAFSGNSCTDVPPTAGVPYFYMVSATNSLGTGVAAGPVSAGLLPAAPSPTASSALQQVLLTWPSVPSATSYSLLRSTLSGGPYASLAIGLTNLLYTDTAVTGGNSYYYLVTASNAIGAGPASTQVSATAFTPIQSWRQQWFGTTDNAGSATDTANPSGDGMPNLMKYALGMNPLSTNAAARPYAVLSNGCLQISFTMTNDPLLLYGVEVTGDFSAWTNIWSSTGTSNSNGPVTVRDTNAPVSSTTRRFLRLRVTAP